MKVALAYGDSDLIVELPEFAQILRCTPKQGLDRPRMALREALRSPIQSAPLGKIAQAGQKVVITHSDITRAVPNRVLVPIIIDELHSAGVKPEDITLLNALGTHRKQTRDELRTLLGPETVDRFCSIQHDAFQDQNLVAVGRTSSGHNLRLNRSFVEADLRILTGLIEPHFFAGFTGGPKGILPALAGFESVQFNHGFDMIAHPKSSWGIREGNPIWEEMCEASRLIGTTFLVNVTCNSDHQITGIFAGDVLDAHMAGCQEVRKTAMSPLSEPADIVITTNGGYPLDQNLYQSVKGLSAADQIVREGGSIILAAACSDGLPEAGNYAQLLQKVRSPADALEQIRRGDLIGQDQWQVQIQAQIQERAKVWVFSGGLTHEQIQQALFLPTQSVEAALSEALQEYGPNARLAVLPEGPQTIPYLLA